MTCVHLKELYRICQQHELKLSSGDLIHIVCPSCQQVDVCPSAYTTEVEQREKQGAASDDLPPPETTTPKGG